MKQFVVYLFFTQVFGCGPFTLSGDLTYDMSPFRNTIDYSAKYNGSPYATLNVCRALVKPCQPSASGCQDSPAVPMGTFTTETFTNPEQTGEYGYGVLATYSGGQDLRNYRINFVCDWNAGLGNPEFVQESPKLRYNFLWNSKYACPTNREPGTTSPLVNTKGKLSGGSILLIILLVLVVVYLIGGIVFNKYKRGLSGVQLIPNLAFWGSIPGYVRDGFKFLIGKCRGNPGYQPV
eukprot:TRINITY_DN3832_c0_g1_i1.p1 TRINITY_DN3832_c0_g1~~TRINITY_DN3832_c0_g1_i1.p1  ORF type:complete len:235 (-),score=36.05 TRINITY_DN3832_c0_g1_i1:32-736(-)